MPLHAWDTDRVGRENDAPLEPGWKHIGSFKGTAAGELMGRVNDLMFDHEADGSLYRDLGDVSLGLNLSPENGTIRWDNSFYRRILPLHREVEPGGVITGEDLSSYLDLRTLISRGRLGYSFITDIIGDEGFIGVEGEGGVSLTLGRGHPAIHLGDRPLEEALADADHDLEDLTREWPKGEHKSLLRLSTEGIAWLTRWIADSIGRGVVDTERAEIFYEDYDDTITLFIDLEIPVEAELFTAEDPRLKPGDFVRQITFIGLSPVAAGIRTYGLAAGYRYFYRFLRETTVVKESGGTVLVRVRTGLARGHETTPLKVRPEIRVLGVLTLGYTFFEQVFSSGDGTNNDAIYRVDLEDSRGMAAFKALLGDGTKVQWRPVHAAAVEGDGAVKLEEELREGDTRTSLMRFRCFSLFDIRDQRIATSETIAGDDQVLREIVYARDWSLRKRLGRDRHESRKFIARALYDEETMQPFQMTGDENPRAAIVLTTGLTDHHANGREVQKTARMLRRTLPWDQHPVLDQLGSVDPELETRFVLNLQLLLGDESFDRISTVTPEELWSELADLLLGNAHREAWRSPEARKKWRRAVRAAGRDHRRLVGDDAVSPLGKALSLRARYRIARRTVKKFEKLQSLSRDAGCMPCLTGSFGKWKYTTLMQMLMARLGHVEGGTDVGYHYEVFIDEMLRPTTVSNDTILQAPQWRDLDDVLRESVAGVRPGAKDLELREDKLTKARAGWQGDRFLQPSVARLERGDVLLNIGAAQESGTRPPSCLALRLYSDVRFAEDLSLRVDLRKFRGIKKDTTIGHAHFTLGEPTAIVETPFLTSRFSYDVPLPVGDYFQDGETYSLLLRILNVDGLAVSEEQQLQLIWPDGVDDMMADGCFVPELVRW